MKIVNLYPRKLVSKNATDYLYKDDIKQLCSASRIEFESLGLKRIDFLSNLYILLTHVFSKFPILRRVLKSKSYWSFKRRLPIGGVDLTGVDIIFTNNLIPTVKPLSKVVLEADFIPYGSSSEIVDKVERQLYISDKQLHLVDRIIVRNKESIKVLEKRSVDLSRKCVVIPHYMPYLKSIESEVFFKKWSDCILNIVFVGNQANRKGIDFLVELYKKNRDFFDEKISVTIVSNFTDGFVDLPPSFKVFRGLKRNQVFSLLKESHFFIMPTKEEAFGKVYVESMAAGCIPFIPNVYPLTCYFEGGACYFDLNDPDSLIDQINDLILDKELLIETALNSLNCFNEVYNPENVSAKYLNLFMELCDK